MIKNILKMFGVGKAAGEDFGSRCILIVDDNTSDLLLVRRTIEKMGHRVITAATGKEGIELAKREKPDLILSDCRMPEMSGVEMFKRMKEYPEIKDIPFVFLTGVESPSVVVECFDMGAENYICKPINPKLLSGQITEIFREHLASTA